MPGLESILSDAYNFIKMVKEDYPQNFPIGLIGYSLGGGISLSLLIKYPNLVDFFLGIAPLAGLPEFVD